MYSLVLMAALSTGGEAPNFFFHRCSGCYGGCWGCNGCWGGCYGCWGSSYGCHGWRHRWAGHGCWGCNGCWGCHGGYSACYGGCYGAGYGCYGGCYGGCYSSYHPVYPAAQPTMPAGEAPRGEPVPPPKKGAQLFSPARLVVELPENAKFYVDDQLMKTATGSRTFNTPALQPGQTYYYILRAEVERDAKTYQETKRVLVRAGETVRASFPELERSLATIPATSAATSVAAADDGDEP